MDAGEASKIMRGDGERALRRPEFITIAPPSSPRAFWLTSSNSMRLRSSTPLAGNAAMERGAWTPLRHEQLIKTPPPLSSPRAFVNGSWFTSSSSMKLRSTITSPLAVASPTASVAGDAMERGDRAPLLPEGVEPKVQDESIHHPLLKHKKRRGGKAATVVLGFQCLESTAFNGISTNLVVYLETVLHGSNVASASSFTTWFGTSYLVPILGAVMADTFWGNYNTVLVSLAVYLLGMLLVTFSAFLPTAASSSLLGAQTVAFVGLYLVAFGSGGVRSALLPFGADQFDDEVAAERESKAAFFSWFYLCVDFGPIVSGVFLVWIQQNVSWGLGFGIATACLALATAAFLLATPMYKRTMPTGTPLKSLCQVAVAACRNASLPLPADADLLHEVAADNKFLDPLQPQLKIAHTTEFAFLDKAAIVVPEAAAPASPWALCTVTQVEELKILLRLLPIWASSVVVSAAYTQMSTTFVQQGNAMDTTILSLPVPAASLASFEVLCVLAWVLLYTHAIVPALHCFSSPGSAGDEPSQLQRMGVGRVLMALAMAAAAVVEARRLGGAARGEARMSIAWQLPQYFLLAGGEVFCYIAQLEFFFGEAPDTMKSMCTSLALLTVALGSYTSSFIYAVVDAVTATGGSQGWISDDLDRGHLDYFFWAMAAMCALNFVVYSAFAKNYKIKTMLS